MTFNSKRQMWSDKVQAIYEKYVKPGSPEYIAFEFGRGHIVWSDGNVEDEHIRYCLGLRDDEFHHPCEHYIDWYDSDVIDALEELLLIPEDERECEE